MPITENEIKPLTPEEIRSLMALVPITGTEIARSVQRKTGRTCVSQNVSRVINRTEGFWFPEIIRELARVLKVEEWRIGRTPTAAQVKRARTIAQQRRAASIAPRAAA